MNFKAVVLDFDGTITEKGVPYPSRKMAELLGKVGQKMPIAFCTGRDFPSFEKHGLGVLIEEIEVADRENFMKNLFVMAENGAIGFAFDEKKAALKEFYRVEWPEEIIPKMKLIDVLQKKIKGFGEMIVKHEIPVVMRALINGKDYRKSEIKEIYETSNRIFKATEEVLKKLVKNFEKYFYIGDSGIGVIIGPKEGNKDNGVKRFAEYLRKNRGYKIGKKAREILCIGDRPLSGGNDYFLLNGTYGTPFTVGDFDKKSKLPKAVYSKKKERLLHEKGTSLLLNEILG